MLLFGHLGLEKKSPLVSTYIHVPKMILRPQNNFMILFFYYHHSGRTRVLLFSTKQSEQTISGRPVEGHRGLILPPRSSGLKNKRAVSICVA